MARYRVVIEVEGQTGGNDDEREKVAFEAALNRGYEKRNRQGYSTLRVLTFEKLDDSEVIPKKGEKLR